MRARAIEFVARETVGLVEDELLIGVEFVNGRTVVADLGRVARRQDFLPASARQAGSPPPGSRVVASDYNERTSSAIGYGLSILDF